MRDAMLGGIPHDVDLATSATPDVVRRLFPRTYVQGSGEVHGTIGVIMGDATYEVTTYRRDVATDGRHATVAFTRSLEEDLARRDFTINAIAVRPDPREDYGAVIDPFNGRSDLGQRILRAVGDPKLRFEEDYLRLMRAYRFAARYHLAIEQETHDAIRGAVGGLPSLSRERIRDEILKMATEATKPGSLAETMARMEADGVLGIVLPEASGPGAAAIAAWADRGQAANPRLRLALMLLSSGVEAASAAGRRLALSNEDRGYVAELVRRHREAMETAVSGPTPASIRRLAHALSAGVTLRDMHQMLIATDAPDVAVEAFGQAVDAHEQAAPPLRLRDLAVTGQDVMVTTGARGPEVGQRLQRLLDAVLEDPEVNTREQLLQMLAPDAPGAMHR